MGSSNLAHDDLQNLAKAHLLAKGAFNRAYIRFWQAEIKPCGDDLGWKLLEVFRDEIQEYCFRLNRRYEGVRDAAWEVFRLELVGEANYRFEELVTFVKWYEGLKSRIGRAIGHLFNFHGDSFADLVDSYPLSGRELVERCLPAIPRVTVPDARVFSTSKR